MRYCVGCASDVDHKDFKFDIELPPIPRPLYVVTCPKCVDLWADVDVSMATGHGQTIEEAMFDYQENFCADTIEEAIKHMEEDPLYG